MCSIANGRGRLQGAKDGGNRPEVRFRVLAVSSGGMTLKSHFLRGGREAMAGQIVRCPSIPHKLETSHGFDSFKAFADHLNNAVVNSYGHAGRAFIDKLMQDRAFSEKRARTLYGEFLVTLNKQHTMTAQMSRTARLFAISAVGLMLASEWGISSISAEQAKQGILVCFADWYAEQPQGDIEDVAFREKVVHTLPKLLGRFVPVEIANNPQNYPRDYVGFVQKGSDKSPDTFDMLPAHFYELFNCEDKEKQRRAYRILGEEMGWLAKPFSGRSWQHTRRVNGSLIRVFRFYGLTPPDKGYDKDQKTKRPKDQKTKRPKDQKTKRPKDQKTKRPKDQKTN